MEYLTDADIEQEDAAGAGGFLTDADIEQEDAAGAGGFLTDADIAQEDAAGAGGFLTDADIEQEDAAGAGGFLTDADIAKEDAAGAGGFLTDADIAKETGEFHESQLKPDYLDIAPTFEQASAGAANVFRGAASAGATLADKGLAAQGLVMRLAGAGLELAQQGAQHAGLDSDALERAAKSIRTQRGGLATLRKNLDAWREKNLGMRNAEGQPTTEFWETIGGQAANAASEIFLMHSAGAALQKARGGTALAEAAQAAATKGKTTANVWRRFRPSAVTTLYGLTQAESTAQKAEDAGRGTAEQLALGMVTGVWEAAMESVSQVIGSQAAMSPAVREGVARAILRTIVDSAFEGTEEALQEGGGGAVEKLAGLDERTWAQIAADAARAFTVGAVSGAAIGGANTAAEASLARRVRDQIGARVRAAETIPPPDARAQPARAVNPVDNLGPLARQAANRADLAPEVDTDTTEGGNHVSQLPDTPAQRQAKPADEAQAKTDLDANSGQAAPTEDRRATRGEVINQPARGRKTRTGGRDVSDALLETDPVRAHVIMLGGIRPDGTEDQAGIPTVYLSARGSGQSLDQMLVEMRDMGLERVADWTVDDLRDHLRGKSQLKEVQRKEQIDTEEKQWYQRGSIPVAPQNLAIGYTFSVRGKAYEVVDADSDGYIIAPSDDTADGFALRLEAGGMMQIDKGSLRGPSGEAVKRLADVADPETLASFEQSMRERDAAASAELESLGFPVDDAEMDQDEDVPFAPRQAAGATETATQQIISFGKEKINTDNGEMTVNAFLRRIEKAPRHKRDDIFLTSVYGNDRAKAVQEMVLRLPNQTGNVQSISDAIAEQYGVMAGTEVNQRLLLGLRSFADKAITTSFTLGLDEVILRNHTSDDIRYSPSPGAESPDQPVTPTQDAEYLAAVDAKDTETAQKMVDKAAKAAGYTTVGYHGARTGKLFHVFDGGKHFFSSDPEVAKRFAQEGEFVLVIDGEETPISRDTLASVLIEPNENADWHLGWNWVEEEGTYSDRARSNLSDWFPQAESAASIVVRKSEAGDFVFKGYLNLGDYSEQDYGGKIWSANNDSPDVMIGDKDGFVARNIQEGGVTAEPEFPVADTIVVAAPSQIKSADAVTYDDQGNVIPLSKRFNEDSDDIRYSTAPGAESPDQPSPRPRGLTIIRRGYDATRSAADDPTYSRLARQPLDLPELVELATDLMQGRTPSVVKRVNPSGTAAGSVRFGAETDADGNRVYGRPVSMALLRDNYRIISAEEAALWQAEAEALYGAGPEADAAAAETARQEAQRRIKAGPRLAMSVIAHEIGHIADQMTRYGLQKLDRSISKNRLNLLGRVAGAIAHTRSIISQDPSGATLSPDETRLLATQARRNAKPDQHGKELFRAVANVWGDVLTAHPEYAGTVSARELQRTLEFMRDTYPALSEWFEITTFQEQTRAVEDALRAFATPGTQAKEARRMGGAWFRREFVARLEARRQAHLKQMYSELESMIAWWRGGDRTMMEDYFKTPSEMFAEAFGVFLNNPGAVQKRAPMFYTTLMAHMETRPKVAQWLAEIDDIMADATSNVHDRRIARISRFFSESTRQQRRQVYDLARRKTTGRTAWDGAQYFGWSKSSPLRAAIRQAERMGHKRLADEAADNADRLENLRGIEELYRVMNNEIGQVLDEGGLTVQDFDTYALLDMVSRSPAYVGKAAPLGLHPEAARQTMKQLHTKLGDAAFNTLTRAVETAQRIWQTEIINRLDTWGGYDPQLIQFMRNNPVYFTLQVGMDDGELAEWQAAIQSGDEERLSAAAMRAVAAGLPAGQNPTGQIHTRSGTHRPAQSLLGATMLKGEALLRAAAHNEAARQAQGLLQAVNDPLYMPIEESDKTARDTAVQLVVSYRVVAEDSDGNQKSQTVRYYAPKYIGHFLRGDNPIRSGNSFLQASRFYMVHRSMKLFQTVFSFKFMVTQPHADRKAWNTLMPGVRTPFGQIARGHLIGGLAQMIPASTWIFPPSFFPQRSRERHMRPMRELARAYYRTGKIDRKIKQLVERGMNDLGGAWQGVGRDNPHPGEIAGTTSPLQTKPQSFAIWEKESSRAVRAMRVIGNLPIINTFMRGFHWTQESMYAETLANKLAGMEYLDKFYPDMPERQKREWVLKAAGNPNFASRGGADPIIDTFSWAFYNPAKEGYRALAYSAKNDLPGFAIRTAYYNLLPNLLIKLSATGLLAAGLERLLPHGDSPEDEETRNNFIAAFRRWTSLFARINSYYGRRYVAIPILPVGTDSVLALTVPQAQSFEPINAIINTGIDELAQAGGLDPDDDKAIENVVKSVTSVIPGVPFLYGSGKGMIEQTIGPTLNLLLTDKTNVYDPFYGRMMLDRNEEDILRANKYSQTALPAWQTMAKHAYNSAFGSMLGRFDTVTPRPDRAIKTDLQKIITAPGVGALIGGWLRITGGGEAEDMQALLEPEIAERAGIDRAARRAAVETLNSPDNTFPAWAAEAYATRPEFRRAYNNFRAHAARFADLTPAERIIFNKSSPKWKRQIVREYQIDQQLRAKEPRD